MPRSSLTRVQDSVHGLMEFSGMATVVINLLRTPELQRLRRVRQLGLAPLVFPGAEHSRFAYSLGAAHVALRFGNQLREPALGLMIDLLCPTAEAIRDLSVAALCHDLGHGPLSHAWEREIIGEGYDAEKWSAKLGLAELPKMKWHELVAQGLLAWEDGELHKLLERDEDGFSARIARLLRGEYYIPYLPRLLSSDVDVDRCDFLLRDAHQCGVTYGSYDLDWLISTCCLGTYRDDMVVGFDARKALRVVEQFLIARRAMYDTVYFHRTVRSAEGMAGSFLRRLKNLVQEEGETLENEEFVKPLVKMISGEAVEQNDLLKLDDFAVWVLIERLVARSKDPTVKDLGQRILSRDLFKRVPCDSEKANAFLRRKDSFPQMYQAIRAVCPGKPEHYLVIDETNFSMFENSDGGAGFLVDAGAASKMSEHEALKGYVTKPHAEVRIFTLEPAVEAIRALIEKKPQVRVAR